MTIQVYKTINGNVMFKSRVKGDESERLHAALVKIKPLLDMGLPISTIADALQEILTRDRVILL